MRAFEVTAYTQQPEVIWQGKDAIVHYNQRTRERTEEDGSVTTQYVYTGVYVASARRYANLTEVAAKTARDFEIEQTEAEGPTAKFFFDKRSQNDISTALAAAAGDFLKAVAAGTAPQTAAQAVLAQTTDWKTADGFKTVSFEEFIDALKDGGVKQTALYVQYG